jgi:hypothetical protein
MPHRANRLIVDEMVDQGWFQDPRTRGLPSGNWWPVEDAHGQPVPVYVVRYSSESERAESEKLPNEPALPRIAELHQDKSLTEGPFIALAKASDSGWDPEILSIRVWRIPSQYLSRAKRVRVDELGSPVFACWTEQSY